VIRLLKNWWRRRRVDRPYSQSERQLLDYTNATPALMSMLYDADMMPEQCISELARRRLFIIIAHWRNSDRARTIERLEKEGLG
jgi:hypothetical protein